MITDPLTTVTLRRSIVRRLRLYKVGGQTYADVLEGLMDAVPPAAFLAWAERELARPATPYPAVRKSLLPARRSVAVI